MKIQVNIEKHIVKGFDIIGRPNCRKSVMSAIEKYRIVAGRDFTIGYNLEKRRKVVKMMEVPIVGKNGRPTKKTELRRVVVTQAHWTANVYVIPNELLKMAGKRVLQHHRHFILVPM